MAESLEDNVALTGALAVAVLIEIDRLRGMLDEQRLSLARECGQAVAEHGDDLQFGSRREGAAAAVFAKLATGLACAAYQPGGITVAGQHWCTNHAECVAAAQHAATSHS